jgi:hypothetical protein
MYDRKSLTVALTAFIHMNIYSCECTYIHIYICLCICVNKYISIYMYIHRKLYMTGAYCGVNCLYTYEYIFMWMYIYTCIYINIHIHIYIFMYIHIQEIIHDGKSLTVVLTAFIYMNVHSCEFTYIYKYTCSYICLCICVNKYVHLYVYTQEIIYEGKSLTVALTAFIHMNIFYCECTYIHIYIHVHINIHIYINRKLYMTVNRLLWR